MKTLFQFFKRANLLMVLTLATIFINQKSEGQTAASATWALTSNANAVSSGNVTAGPQTDTRTASYGSTGVSSNSWNSGDQDANDWYQFTISPTTGNNLTVTTITMLNSFSLSSGTALIQYSFSSAFTSPQNVGSSYTVSTSESSHGSTSLSISVAEGQTLYVRVYAWDASFSFVTFRTRNVVISGTTVPSCTVPSGVSASANPNPICPGANLNLVGSATDATSWSWTGPNGFTSNLQNPTITGITAAGAGVYHLTASNTCGSAAVVNTASVTVRAQPVAEVQGHQDINCYAGSNGTITVLASGGTGPYKYAASTDGINFTWITPSPASTNPYAIGSGSEGGLIANQAYRIKVKDNNDCISK